MNKKELERIAFIANFQATKCWQMTEPWLSMPPEEKAYLARFVKESNLVVTAIQSTLAIVHGRQYSEFEIDAENMRNGGMSVSEMEERVKVMEQLELPALAMIKNNL